MYKTTGLTHLINSTKYSLQGLKSAFKNETAFRHECFLACIMIPLAFWLGDTKIEIALMISSVLLVMAVELLNSAVEAVVDRIGTERHELSGKVRQRYSSLFALLSWFGEVFYFSKVRSIFSNNFGLCVLHKPFLYNVHKHLYTSVVLDISRYSAQHYSNLV